MKKFIVTLLSIGLSISILAGCQSKEASETSAATEKQSADAGNEKKEETEKSEDSKADEDKDVTEPKGEIVWIAQGVGEDAWEGRSVPILEKFTEETGIKVTGEFYSFGDLFDVIEVKIASGSKDYDVISVDVPMVASYANRGMLAPMDSYFNADELAQFAESTVAAGSWDGVFYAPPMNTSTQCLWINMQMLEDAGITLPESTTESRLTWEAVAEMAKTVKEELDPDGTNGIIGLEFQQVSRVYQMNALPNSMGGLNIGKDGFTVDGVINDEAWVNALTWYQNLTNEGISSRGITADEISNYFYSGKIAFLVGGTWTANSADQRGPENYTYAPCPAFEGFEDKVGTPTGSWHFGINAASEYYDLAAEFIKFVALGEGNDMWLEINGDVPARIEKLDEIIDDADAPGYLKIGAYEAKNTAVPRALTPGFNEYQTIVGNAWEDIRNGSDVKGSLDSAAEQLNSVMEQYK